LLLPVYLRERKLLQSAPLSSLQGYRLGIDASHYLKSLLSDPDTREPLVASTGGLPLALIARVENDLRTLDRIGIKPVFVFAGLPTASRPPQKGLDPQVEREAQVKNEAWSHYENGQVEKAIIALTEVRHGAWTDHRDVMRLILRIFRHRFVEYIIAPYHQYSQLAYLLKHPKGYVNALFGETETLLWPVDKLIISIDWTTLQMTFVEKARLLGDLQLTSDQFLDLGLLAGCDLLRTFPPLMDNFSLKSVIDMIKYYKTGIQSCQAWKDHPQVKATVYADAFMRARLAVRYSLILTTDGAVLPLPLVIQPQPPQTVTAADVPADLEDIFSMRFPDELYFHICRGLISPQLVGWLSSGMIIESQPLADSPDYRRFIKDVVTEGHTAPRCTTLALLAATLHPQWMSKRVNAHYYFDPPYAPPMGAIVPFADPMTQSLVDKCTTWIVSSGIVDEELRRQNSSTIDIKLCIGALVEDRLAARTRRGKDAPRPLDKKDEIVANIIWRFLDVRGYVASLFTSAEATDGGSSRFVNVNHTQTLMGKALHASVTYSRVNDKFQESLYLILELLRAGVVHGSKWGPPDAPALSGGPSFGSEEDQSSTLLIMRCLSVLPLLYRPQQWAGPLSRELLVFNSFIRSLSKALRYLFEAISVHMLLTGDARRMRDDYIDIALSLPFQGEVNTGFGILAKTYLDAATFHFGDSINEDNQSMETVKQAKKDAMVFVEQSFTSVKGPIQEVERGFRFWDAVSRVNLAMGGGLHRSWQVMVAIRCLNKEQGPTPSLANSVIQQNVIEQFERADKWLRPMRP
ncbi:hypothetical protein P7C73_g6649, partial [Tremellales sp. Uapishka_1]